MIEMEPLLSSRRTDEAQILERHSEEAWPREYLFQQEFDAIFAELLAQYRGGRFTETTDRTDFRAFVRMFRELTLRKEELQSRLFPEVKVEREVVSEEAIREIYVEMRLDKEANAANRFSFRSLFLGCVGR
ncbi:unnamed protein product [Caenorhabditis sp. 36 PRJEB53466]|nr:unnamed protein product [Caenorhabditis sp. 36 PRJEB53466]